MNSSSFTMEFWLSRSLPRIFLSRDGILAITKPFHDFFFHMMESQLSRSLFMNFSVTWWNLGYHEAFSRIFLSHDGISAITKPFHEFFFHMVESRLSRSLFTNFSHMVEFRLSRSLFTDFSFTWWNLGYHEAFSRIFFTWWNLGYHKAFPTMESTKCTIWGKTLFIYITKSIYIGSASLKTLPLDLEPPLQGKEYGPLKDRMATREGGE
jgi:hypothetical protein